MVMAIVVMMMVLMMVVHGANGESSYIHGVRSNPLCGMSFLLICLKFVIYDDDDDQMTIFSNCRLAVCFNK